MKPPDLIEPALADTSFLLAVINTAMDEHEVCSELFDSLNRQSITVWPVLAETAHLLKRFPGGIDVLCGWIKNDIVRVHNLNPSDIDGIEHYLATYRDQKRLDLADACLMHVADTLNLKSVLTLDVGDFAILRKRDGEHLTIFPQP